MKKTKILILGAGVSGLSTGILLLKEGYSVEIWAKDLPPNTTSNVAAAFWMPYLSNPPEKVMKWAKATHEYLEQNAVNDSKSGCVYRTVTEIYHNKVGKPDWADAVDEWRRPNSEELPKGYVDGHQADAMLMDSSLYMDWLVDQYKAYGGELKQQEVKSINEALANYTIVINCTGLGSRTLFNDKNVFPVRGQVVKIKSNGFKNVVADDTDPDAMTVIIPRLYDIVLGGTVQPNNWSLEVDPKDTAGILNRAKAFYPEFFTDVEVIEENVGLRPARDEVRLEVEKKGDKFIIHNYGHGGSGYTLSWGCAQEVVDLVKGL